jgi:hypothetical protein
VTDDLDVVVDMHPRFLPFGEDIRGFGERLECGFIQTLKERPPAAGEFLERPLVDKGHKGADFGIELGKAEEGHLPESRQNPTLHHLHPHFHLGLVAGSANPGGDDGAAVVARHVLVGGIKIGLVEAGLCHAALQIVGDYELGYSTKEGKGPHVGADPVGKRLAPGGLGVGIAAGAKDSDEDLGVADLPGDGINHRGGLPGIVNEELLSGPVLLAHDEIEFLTPPPVLLTEPAVLIALGVGLLVFLPQEKERDPLSPELPVDLRPVRQESATSRHTRSLREEPPFQFGFIELGRQRPAESTISRPAQILAYG